MTKKLFVGNLSWNTTEDSLRGVFEEFGEVSEAKIITDRYTNKSRGFGFVTMTNDESAQTAISKLDGKDLDGRSVKVNEAQEKKPSGDRGNNRW